MNRPETRPIARFRMGGHKRKQEIFTRLGKCAILYSTKALAVIHTLPLRPFARQATVDRTSARATFLTERVWSWGARNAPSR
jgi:hypothetical protein